MVRYLGAYSIPLLQQTEQLLNPSDAASTGTQKDVLKNTYNILLEYCDWDLDEFFFERLPPPLEKEIEAFWMALFEVAEAVEGIHNLKAETGEGFEEYRG
jgi:hypothetical protein